jgi:SAM-dependent methyltransferase
MATGSYLLGGEAAEFARLSRQAALIEAETEALFRSAGIGSGQSVLEIGSGVGDVAMLLGRLVRPDGEVLGIERSADSRRVAEMRIAAAGNLAVRIEAGDLDEFVPPRQVDALAGRFVLPYLARPAEALARLARHVRAGGVVAFMEFDVREMGSDPPVPLAAEIARWIVAAYEHRGVSPGLGSSLGATFHAAGLPWPYLTSCQKASCGPGGVTWYFAELVRTLESEIVASGLASAGEIDSATLERRLEAEALRSEATLYAPRWVSGWCRLPPDWPPA